MKTLFRNLILGIALFIGMGNAVAQDYLITAKGDSLAGELKIFNYGPDKKVQVVGPDKKKKSIEIFQVRSFTLDKETYHPVKGPKGYAFMKVLRDGYLSLYAFQAENQVSYDGRFLLKKDGSGIEVPNLSFKKSLKKFLDDCPSVASKIDAGVYSRTEIEKLVDDYNSCILGKTSEYNATPVAAVVVAPPSRPWVALEEKVKTLPEFSSKSDALEMITEIQKKISKSEKVPNFMIEGLKGSLADKGVDAELSAALQEIK